MKSIYSHKDFYMNIHGSISYNSLFGNNPKDQQLVNTWTKVIHKMDIVFSNKREPTTDTWHNIDKRQKYAEWQKTQKTAYFMILFVYKVQKMQKQWANYWFLELGMGTAIECKLPILVSWSKCSKPDFDDGCRIL